MSRTYLPPVKHQSSIKVQKVAKDEPIQMRADADPAATIQRVAQFGMAIGQIAFDQGGGSDEPAVQRKENRTGFPHALKGAPLNDDPALEREADEMGAKAVGVAQAKDKRTSLPVIPSSRGPIQAQIKMKNDLYKPYGRNGLNPDGFVRKMNAKRAAADLSLRQGWQTEVRDMLAENKVYPYLSWAEILEEFKSESNAAKRKLKLEAQDTTIAGLLTHADGPAKKRARTIAYESTKALGSVRDHIQSTQEYADTLMELEGLPAGAMGAANEITKTTNPAFVFEALDGANMNRLDFNFGGVPIMTHGYESMKDRTVSAQTLNPFGFGPIKVGDGIGSYAQALKKGVDIRGPEHQALIALEMFRIPQSSAMLGLKRDLYEQGHTNLNEAISQSSTKSNVEFVGAVRGSGLTADQGRRMREQQINSNHFTLADYTTRFPNHDIGYATADGKARVTPRRISRALDELRTNKDKPAKKKFRRRLKRSIASTLNVDGYDSNSDVSDYDDDHYKK